MADDSDNRSSRQDAEGSSQGSSNHGTSISFDCRWQRACNRDFKQDAGLEAGATVKAVVRFGTFPNKFAIAAAHQTANHLLTKAHRPQTPVHQLKKAAVKTFCKA